MANNSGNKRELHPPKLWALEEEETLSSFNEWKSTIVAALRTDPRYERYIEPDATGGVKTANNPNRDYQDDGLGMPAADRRTATQKAADVDQFLEYLSLFAQVIPQISLVKEKTTCLNDVWR